jgi:lipoyl synthase
MIHKPSGSPVISVDRLPLWFKQDVPDIKEIRARSAFFERESLHTVCQDARCPNLGQCWKEGVATFMILGNICTRGCRFCAVKTGQPLPLDLEEPRRVARAVGKLKLRYVVITSVTRDDLADGGAEQFARTVECIRELFPETKVEFLIPDFQGNKESLKTIVEARPDVIGHNLETVRRLSGGLRPQAGHDRSLEILRKIKALRKDILTKSGFMVGLGETRRDIEGLLGELLSAGCDIVTIGQYLAPSKNMRHWPVDRFVPPQEFDDYKRMAQHLGFKSVMSAPLVRSSYLAEQAYRQCQETSQLKENRCEL